MNAAAFSQLIRNPTDQTTSVQELQAAVQAYPWCQPLRVLLSVRAHAEGHAERTGLLGQAAVHTFYRSKLRQLHEAYLDVPAAPSARNKTARAEPTIDLVAEVGKVEAEHTPDALRAEEIPPAKSKVAKPAPIKDPAKTDDQAKLIDEFLASQEGVRVRRKDLPDEPPSSDLAAGSTRFDGLIISETMAKMYMRQGQPEKAAYIVEKLSLKFPEKSAYFAGILKSGGPEA